MADGSQVESVRWKIADELLKHRRSPVVSTTDIRNGFVFSLKHTGFAPPLPRPIAGIILSGRDSNRAFPSVGQILRAQVLLLKIRALKNA